MLWRCLKLPGVEPPQVGHGRVGLVHVRLQHPVAQGREQLEAVHIMSYNTQSIYRVMNKDGTQDNL